MSLPIGVLILSLGLNPLVLSGEWLAGEDDLEVLGDGVAAPLHSPDQST